MDTHTQLMDGFTHVDGSGLYYGYYITQALFQEGGSLWESWNPIFSHGLVEAQTVLNKEASRYIDHNGDAQETGYWKSPTAREHNGGNGEIMDTILCTLMLEVYYRYTPIYLKHVNTDETKPVMHHEDITFDIIDRPLRL